MYKRYELLQSVVFPEYFKNQYLIINYKKIYCKLIFYSLFSSLIKLFILTQEAIGPGNLVSRYIKAGSLKPKLCNTYDNTTCK